MANSRVFPIDTHVHLHPGQDPARGLSAAVSHMEGVGAQPVVGCLMLTESTGVDAFGGLRGRIAEWTIAPTREPVSRIATRDDGLALIVVAGRQIVTREGIEVLALGLGDALPEGERLSDTLAGVARSGAVAVLPYGFGKWRGARGACVAAALNAPAPPLLADSGVRPGALRRHPLLARAEAGGRPVLAGTDPLPLPGEERQVGRFGICIARIPDPATPFADIKDSLARLGPSPPTYGRLETLPRFLRNQAAMQWRKRTG